MRKTLSLILPILVPSWRFFKSVEPSPRIQWAVFPGGRDDVPVWHPLRPRPTHVPVKDMVRRLFWNPDWNQSLFLVACAERIVEAPTDHSIAVIQSAVREASQNQTMDRSGTTAQFRLVFMSREGAMLREDVLYQSSAFPLIPPEAP